MSDILGKGVLGAIGLGGVVSFAAVTDVETFCFVAGAVELF